MTRSNGVNTLAYAEPVDAPVFPLRWALNGLIVFAVATLVERGTIWLMLFTIFRDRGGFRLNPRDVVDYVLPPLAAVPLLWMAIRERRGTPPRLTRPLAALCGVQVLLAVASVVFWSLTLLPRVWATRGGPHDGVVWEAELIHVRLLPVAWPLAVAIFAATGPPTPRRAAATLTIWSIATWAIAACATAALWHQRGMRALSPEIFQYTVAPAWTFMLLPVIGVGVFLWLGNPPARIRWDLCVAAALFWLAAAALRAWHDERFSSVRNGAFAQLLDLGNSTGVAAELISDLVLWQIAPLALLLFLARPPHPVH